MCSLSSQLFRQVIISYMIGWLLLGLAYQSFGYPPEALEPFDSVKQRIYRLNTEDSEAAIQATTQRLAKWKHSDSTERYANLLNLVGILYFMRGNMEKAKPYFLQALSISEKYGHHRAQASSYWQIAALYKDRQERDSSLAYLRRFLAVPQDLADPVDRAHTYAMLGDLLTPKQVPEAASYLHKAAEEFFTLGKRREAGAVLLSLGVYYAQSGQLQEGILKMKEAIRLIEEEGDIQLINSSYANLGGAYLEIEQFDSALWALNTSLEGYRRVDDSSKFVHLFFNMALAYEGMGNYDASIPYLKEALSWADSSHSAVQHQMLQKALSNGFSEVGEYDSAYYHLSSAYQVLENRFDNQQENDEKELRKLLQKEVNRRELLVKEKELANSQYQKTILIGSVLLLAMLLLIAGLLISGYRRRQVAQQQELASQKAANQRVILELLQDQETDLLNAVLDAKDEERERIASDLHDSLGGTLSAVQVSLSMIKGRIAEEDERARKAYDRTKRLLDDACDEVRRVSHNLVDNSLRLGGLEEALTLLGETLKQSNHFALHMELSGLGEQRLDTAVEVNLYRIIQELFQNIIKHANARHVRLQVSRVRKRIFLVVEDDGEGFDPHETSKGLGLNSIRARVEKFKGKLKIDSEPGNGSTFSIEVPI